MTRATARAARLVPLLLACVFFALLAWRFSLTDGGDPGAHAPPAPRRTSRSLPARTPISASAPAPRIAGGKGSAPLSPGPHELSMPIAGVEPGSLRDNFLETRGGTRAHEALDIVAPRGTPVLAVDDGFVRKLFTSVPGGLTVYQFDREERYCYYYAHLDGYAPGLHEGQELRRGDLIGTVGTTGNAAKDAPHLHFAVSRLDRDKRWWTGTPVNPYPLLVRAR